MSQEKSKYDRVNRFLFKCGVLWRDEIVDNPPPMDLIMERMQDEITRDTVRAVIEYDELGIIRKLNAISSVLGITAEETPKIQDKKTDYVKSLETINLWDYILKISRRDDWMDYTIEGYERMSKEKEG